MFIFFCLFKKIIDPDLIRLPLFPHQLNIFRELTQISRMLFLTELFISRPQMGTYFTILKYIL